MSNNQQTRRDDVDIFAEAKKLSLSAFIERELNVEAKLFGTWLRYNCCPNCGPSRGSTWKLAVATDDRNWACHKCGEKGSIIDAGAFMWTCSPLEAARSLLGISSSDERKVQKLPPAREVDDAAEAEAKAKRAAALRDVFGRLQRACLDMRDEPKCLAYLVEERKLDIDVVRQAQASGMVGFLPSDSRQALGFLKEVVGEQLLRESELWKKDAKSPAIAYRPLVFFMPGVHSAEFRVIKATEQGSAKSITYGLKKYPHWWNGSEPQCLITEGLIDGLSAVTMGFKGHVMALPGCNNVSLEWLSKAAARYKLSRFVIGLDNDVDDPDNTGQEAAQKISKMCMAINVPSFIKAPVKGDINDILRARASEQLAKAA